MTTRLKTMRKATNIPMTDKERILMQIIKDLKYTYALKRGFWGGECFKGKRGDPGEVHYAPWEKKLKKGMLVVCDSSPLSPWSVAFIEEVYGGYDGCLLREVGTDNLCHMQNEGFTPLLGWEKRMYAYRMGDEYNFQIKVDKAFGRGGEYLYRYGGVEFHPNNEVTIWVREVFNGGPRGGTKPFPVKMKWNKKTTIKSILETMRNQGYGTKKFELINDKNEVPVQ